MKELSKIAQKYLTDKGITFGNSHGYTEIYNDYFKKIKEDGRKVNILEIGVQYGHDLLMLNEYFDGNCEIWGIDINTQSLAVELPENIHVITMDGTDGETIDSWLSERYGGAALYRMPRFDIIIDDGSHWAPHILTTLTILYKYLTYDGIYIIEDLHAPEAADALYYLNFFDTDGMENVTKHIKTCNIHHIFNNYNNDFIASKCAVLTFNLKRAYE